MPEPVDIAVVLAAGGGSRIGLPKGLLMLEGKPLVRHHVDALREFAGTVVIALGARAEEHRPHLQGMAIVHNPDWDSEWPADTLARALRAYPPAGRVLVTPVDTPPASAAVLGLLTSARGDVVPVGPSGDGHPVLLSLETARGIAEDPPAGGLRAVLRGANRVPVGNVDVSSDFDTAASWRRYLSERGASG